MCVPTQLSVRPGRGIGEPQRSSGLTLSPSSLPLQHWSHARPSGGGREGEGAHFVDGRQCGEAGEGSSEKKDEED